MASTLTKQEKINRIKEFFGKTKLDPKVTKITLGKEFSSISPELLRTTSQKLIKINKGEVEPDDRDNLMFSRFLGLEDYIKDHIHLDAGKLQTKARIKMDQKKNLSFMDAGFFTPQIRSTIVSNSLAQNLEGINPMEMLNVSHKLTKMGEGGISSSESIPDSSRMVQDSSYGLVDPLQISEDNQIGITAYFVHGLRKGEDGKLYKLVHDKDSKPVWIDHETLLQSRVKIPNH